MIQNTLNGSIELLKFLVDFPISSSREVVYNKSFLILLLFASYPLFASQIIGPVIKDMKEIQGGEPPVCLISMTQFAYSKNFRGKCSATLIDKKHIITAAHCVPIMLPEKTKILCGKEMFNLKSVYKSKKYKDESGDSTTDFAIAELDQESKVTTNESLG